MSYTPVTEKIPVAPMHVSGTRNSFPDYRQNGDIRRTRRILLVLLAIELVLTVFYFIERIVALVQYYRLPVSSRDASLNGVFIGNLVAAGISVLYAVVFIVIVFKYVRIGILIFAWLGLIQLICVLIVIVLAIVAIVAISAAAHSVGVGLVASVVVIIIAAIACILTILIVIFSFKLAKLLKMHEAYQCV